MSKIRMWMVRYLDRKITKYQKMIPKLQEAIKEYMSMRQQYYADLDVSERLKVALDLGYLENFKGMDDHFKKPYKHKKVDA